ncbi:MAG: hypothetical protein HC830_04165 [Bacteroidetes bacterium]|nr:hypothetical protein [Bacteroidota bacterium]
MNDKAIIDKLFTLAGYTYGPLLGLFTYGMFTRWNLRDKWVPVVVILSPVVTYLLDLKAEKWLSGYKFGFELLIVNALLTFIGLYLIRIKRK